MQIKIMKGDEVLLDTIVPEAGLVKPEDFNLELLGWNEAHGKEFPNMSIEDVWYITQDGNIVDGPVRGKEAV